MVLLWAIPSSFFMFGFLFFVQTSARNLHLTEETAQTFIVRVQNDLKPSVFSHVENWYASTLQSLNSNLQNGEIHDQFDQTVFLHVYKTVFHGFSARLTQKQAQQLLQNRPEVLAVLPDKLRQLHTTRSPEFLGISNENNPTGLLTESDQGSNVVIGVLDTGIWPERRSFHDKGLGPIPSHWKGECVEGEKFTKSHCNNKIIGARFFIAGYESKMGGRNSTEELKSPRDSDGHGTHTSSTAAGRAVANASLFGFAQGMAVGIAPKARLAAYKICWKRGCMDSDILAGIDKAVEDGVDVISISVGGGAVAFNLDPIAIGSFAAMEKGILVSASAGNDGPNTMTVTNLAPWITTVGASTIDRKFPADLVLGDGQVLKGAALYPGDLSLERTYFPLVYAGNISARLTKGFGPVISWFSSGTCLPDSIDKDQAKGKIVLCDRGGNARVAKGEVVQKAGGIGVLVANVAPLGEGITADAHLIPGLSIIESAGNKVRAYINSDPNPRARMVFRGTEVGSKPAPVVASFSSRGPNGETPYVLKPDIIAPGVNILAAWPDNVAPTELSSDERRADFNIISGTSMSCPHVSGIAALLKGAHPDWSPAMIRSAMMTTATMHDNAGNPLLDEQSYNESTIWAMGAGQVNPEKAVDPGLVYDLTIDDYVDFLCITNYSRQAIRQIARKAANCMKVNNQPWNINYPAISVAFESPGSSNFEVAVTRTVTYVSDGASSYNVTVTNPKGVVVSVNPSKMDFEVKGQKQSYVVVIKVDALKVKVGTSVTEWGKLVWSDASHQVTSPLVVLWRNMY